MQLKPIVSSLVVIAALATAGCGSSSTKAASPAPAATTSAAGSASSNTTPGEASTASTASAAGGTTKVSTADPCSLTTVAAITAAFGGTVATGAADTKPEITNPTCQWAVTGANVGGDGDVFISVNALLGDPTKFGYAKTGIPNAIDLPGIGDSAFYSTVAGSVDLHKGNTALMVQGVFLPNSQVDRTKLQADLTALATQVASGL